MSYSEVNNVIGSRDKKDYKYRCDQDWLKTYCNREECVKRKLGIGGGIDNELVLGPLSFVTSSPKIWYLGFNGDEVRLYSKELVKQDLAREAATEQTGKTPPKIKNWDLQIRTLQQKATPIDAPEESLPEFKLKSHLEDFCFNLRITKDRKQIVMGRPFSDGNGKRKFIFDGFYKHLQMEEWKLSVDLTHQMLQKCKGISREKFHIKEGVKKWVYVLDEVAFGREPEVEQDILNFKSERQENDY